jgi:hypothetical protein
MRYSLVPLTAILLTLSCVSPAFGAATQAAEIPQLAPNSYKQDFGVSTQVAERNLETQQRGAGIVEVLEGTLGNDYAGVCLTTKRVSSLCRR